MLKFLGPLFSLLKLFGTMFVGGKLVRDRNKIKDLKDQVEATEIKDDLKDNTASDDVDALDKLRNK